MGGNLGINPDRLLTLRLVLPADKYFAGFQPIEAAALCR